jgi:hypothetical protein
VEWCASQRWLRPQKENSLLHIQSPTW